MNDKLERELKLPAHFSLARLPRELSEFIASPVHFHRLHTIYYDTADLRLTRWGCSLRYRHGEGWTLKTSVPNGGEALVRREHVFAGDADVVPDAARDLATAYVRGAPLRRVAELRTLRASRDVRNCEGSDVAEIVEDDVRVVDDRHVVKRFRQVEIELAESASPDMLDTLGAVLREEGAGAPDATPKNVYALGDPAGRAELEPCALGRRASGSDVVRATLSSAVERLVRSDATLRVSCDREAVHQTRVALRTIRSNLRTFLPLLERAWACALRDEIEWAADGFAAARDADVVLARMERRIAVLAGAESQAAERVLAPLRHTLHQARAHLLGMIREPRYAALVDRLIEAAARPYLAGTCDEDARRAFRALLEKAWKRLRKRVHSRRRPASDRELHHIRIKAKYVRYAAEAFAPVADKPARAFARKVEALQDVLGEQHDAVVAVDTLRNMTLDADAAFVAGELTAQELQSAGAARERWRDAWRAVRRKRNACFREFR